MATSMFLERFHHFRSVLAMFFRMGAVGWIIVLVLIVMILGMIDNMFFHRGAMQNAAAPQTGQGVTSAATNPSGSSAPTAPTATVPPGASSSSGPTPLPDPSIAAAARAELSEAIQLVTEAEDSTDQAIARITAWETDVEPLRGNADGQAIAAHTDLAGQMAFLLEQPRPSKSDLQRSSERIKSLRDETDRLATIDPPKRLDTDKMLELRKLHRQAREASTVWTDAVERARAIAREAKRKAPPTTVASASSPSATAPEVSLLTPAAPSPVAPAAKATVTVAPAAPAGSSTASAIPAPVAVAAQEPTPAKGATLEAKVKEIADKSRIDALNEQIAKEAERKRKEEERLEVQRKLDEQLAVQKAKLAVEARSEEVQRVLQPFLVRRSIQPRLAGASVQWRQTTDQQPMSLSAIENVGALAETVQGLSTLARIGSHRELSSPRWEFSPSPRTWSSDTQDRLKQAQDLLRRLGPTLVEERLLSP